jgi:hypothetical protein
VTSKISLKSNKRYFDVFLMSVSHVLAVYDIKSSLYENGEEIENKPNMAYSRESASHLRFLKADSAGQVPRAISV